MGMIFKIPAYLVYIVAGLWGGLISLGIAIDHMGFIGGFLAFILAPATLAFVPWYEALANSNWNLVFIVYGGAILAGVLHAIGSGIDGE